MNSYIENFFLFYRKSTLPNEHQQTYPGSSGAGASQFDCIVNQEENTSSRHRSGRESLSSISVESLGSIEAEQALLQCISSGKPKSNSISPTKNVEFSRYT